MSIIKQYHRDTDSKRKIIDSVDTVSSLSYNSGDTYGKEVFICDGV